MNVEEYFNIMLAMNSPKKTGKSIEKSTETTNI